MWLPPSASTPGVRSFLLPTATCCLWMMFLPPVQHWKPARQFWWKNWGAGSVLLRWRMWSRLKDYFEDSTSTILILLINSSFSGCFFLKTFSRIVQCLEIGIILQRFMDGNFCILAPSNGRLAFHSEGMKTHTVPVKGQTKMMVFLEKK